MRSGCCSSGAAPNSETATGRFGAEAATHLCRWRVCAAKALAAMSRPLASNNAVPLKVAQREATPEKFLPYARHVNQEMGALDSGDIMRSEEHTSELQSLMRISYAVFCL